jgi:hypothetical protein
MSRAAIRAAIVSAFQRNTFDRLLRDRFDWNLANEIDPGGGFLDIVDRVVDAFTADGRLPQLLAAIAAERPLRADLQDLVRLAGPVSGPTPALLDEELQRTVKRWLPDLDPIRWAAKIVELSACVCRIEVDGAPAGTGFLVGPDVVLTCRHVVEAAVANQVAGGAIGCLFDLWRDSSNRDSAGVRTYLRDAFADWHVTSGTSGARTLDYALLRVAEVPPSAGGGSRGFIAMPTTAPLFPPDNPILILQHPRGGPLKLALDTSAVLADQTDAMRIRYTTNTDSGSSGSPCFDLGWNLVALHNGTDPTSAGRFNHGIPIHLIRAQLGPFASLLG